MKSIIDLGPWFHLPFNPQQYYASWMQSALGLSFSMVSQYLLLFQLAGDGNWTLRNKLPAFDTTSATALNSSFATRLFAAIFSNSKDTSPSWYNILLQPQCTRGNSILLFRQCRRSVTLMAICDVRELLPASSQIEWIVGKAKYDYSASCIPDPLCLLATNINLQQYRHSWLWVSGLTDQIAAGS